MKKQPIKIIALLTALLLLITALPMSATAATTDATSVGNYEINGVTGDCSWRIDVEAHHMEIYGSGAMEDYSETNAAPFLMSGATIASVTIYPGVTHIGSESFKNIDLTEVTIPDTVVSIGSSAFEGTKITTLTLPDSVKTIGDKAFCGCTSLASTAMPSTMTSLGKGAFQNCPLLEIITVPEGVTNLKDETFSGCIALEQVYLPKSLKSIGNYAFAGLSKLKTLALSDRLTSIGDGAFNGCTGIETLDLPHSLTAIGDSGLQNTVWFRNLPDGMIYYGSVLFDCKGAAPAILTVPGNVTCIAGGSFRSKDNLMRVKLPTTLKSIGSNSFKNCSDLISVDFAPTTVTTTIGAGAFTNCPDLVFSCYQDTPVYEYAQSNNIQCTIIGGRTGDCIWRQIGTKLIIKGNGAMADYSNKDATPWDTGITEVILCNGVTHIGSWAFTKLTNLQKLVVSKSLTSVSKKNPNYNPKQRPTDINKPMLHHLPYYNQSKDIAIYIHTENENLKDDIKRYGSNHFVYLGKTCDQNGDNKIDVRDVTALQRHFAELATLSDVQCYGADANNDGFTDINDATYLQMFLAEYSVTLN